MSVALNFDTCRACDRRDGGRCRESGQDLARHCYPGVCPLGKLLAARPLPRADLAGYDPETSAQSPKAGGCCGGGKH